MPAAKSSIVGPRGTFALISTRLLKVASSTTRSGRS
jgi:hypothetical protein